MRGRHRGAGSRQSVADAFPRVAPRREELGVDEGDRARRATGQHILAELGRQVDRGDRAPGPDRRCRRAKIVGARCNRNPRRGRQGLNEQPRSRRVVHVDHDDIKSADDGGAEREAEQREGDHRHAEQQEARHRIAPDPANLPRRNRKQSACAGIRRCALQSV